MKTVPRFFVVLCLAGSLFLNGCETADQTATLGVIMDGAGNMLHLTPQQRTAFDIARRVVYEVSESQRREAERRAREALASAAFRRKLERKHTRYVAVPLRANGDQHKTNSKKVVVLYDTKKQEVVDKGYAPAPKHYAEGEEATFGGKEAVVATSFSGV